MKITLVSLDQIWEDKNSNKEKCAEIFKSMKPCDIIIFPEMTLTGFAMDSHRHAEDLLNSPTVEFFKSMAKKCNVIVVFGMIVQNDPKPMNSCIVIDEKGQAIAQYAKVHPFSKAGEDKYFTAGQQIVSFNHAEVNIGLSICYDLRFPELYQGISKKCKVILNIANWPAARVDHWITLLKARAIENQVFMIGVNRTGTDGNNIAYAKSSVIYSPIGGTIQANPVSPEVDCYSIDVSEVDAARQKLPVKSDRKIDFYKNIL